VLLQCIHKLSVPRSADLKSAVSQDCILLGLGVAWGVEKTRHAADFKSAIRQSATLRYGRRNHRQLVDAPLLLEPRHHAAHALHHLLQLAHFPHHLLHLVEAIQKVVQFRDGDAAAFGDALPPPGI